LTLTLANSLVWPLRSLREASFLEFPMLEAQGDIVGEAVRIDRGGSEIQAK
jgi:hypothetical protein